MLIKSAELLSKLSEVKSFLVSFIESNEIEDGGPEYLLDLVDYIIRGEVPCTVEVIKAIIDEVMLIAAFNRNKEPLKLLKVLYSMIGEEYIYD